VELCAVEHLYAFGEVAAIALELGVAVEPYVAVGHRCVGCKCAIPYLGGSAVVLGRAGEGELAAAELNDLGRAAEVAIEGVGIGGVGDVVVVVVTLYPCGGVVNE